MSTTTTLQAIIEQALRKIGVFGRGRQINQDEVITGLDALRLMCDSWALEKLMVPFTTQETFATGGRSVSTIGPGGDFNTVKPDWIDYVHIIDATGKPYSVMLAAENFWHGMNSTGQTGTPTYYVFEDGNPLGRLRFDTAPTAPNVKIISRKGLQFYLNSESPTPINIAASSVSTSRVQDSITLPTGYETALVYNLGLHLCVDFQRDPSALLVAVADTAKARIKNQSVRPQILTMPLGFGGASSDYNINGGP